MAKLDWQYGTEVGVEARVAVGGVVAFELLGCCLGVVLFQRWVLAAAGVEQNVW